MELKIVNGKNYKSFVQITDIVTKEDMEIFETIKQTVYRKEYKPFIQSFDKNISYSYMYNDTFVPVQFIQDIKKQVKNIYGIELQIKNEESLIDNELIREEFDQWLNELKVPDDIKIDDEKYKFQQDCVFFVLQNKIGRIEIATSGGKTFITYLWCRYICEKIRNLNDKAYRILIIVPSKLLAKQLQNDFNKYQKFEERKIIVETIYAGSKRIIDADVVCGTYQSLSDYDEEYFEDFRFIACDEVHRSKAYSIRNAIYNKIKNAEYFFGMSGTYPKYNTLDYLHIVSMFGPLLYKKDLKSLIVNGISTPINLHLIKIEYIENNFSKNLKNQNISGTEKYNIEKEYFQNFNERTNLAVKLLNAYKGNALILVDTVEYCHILQQFLIEKLPQKIIEIIHGKINDRDQIIQDMKNTDFGFILIGTYGTMSTGVSIPNIESVYFMDGGKSDIRIRQSLGRGIRLSPKTGKTSCDVFDFWDSMSNSSFNSHALYRKGIYKEIEIPYKITKIKLDNTEYSENFISNL